MLTHAMHNIEESMDQMCPSVNHYQVRVSVCQSLQTSACRGIISEIHMTLFLNLITLQSL